MNTKPNDDPKVMGTQDDLDDIFRPDRSPLAKAMSRLSSQLVDPCRADYTERQWSDLRSKAIHLRQCIDHALLEHFDTKPSEVPQHIDHYVGDTDPW